jgi:hypothetical protein
MGGGIEQLNQGCSNVLVIRMAPGAPCSARPGMAFPLENLILANLAHARDSVLPPRQVITKIFGVTRRFTTDSATRLMRCDVFEQGLDGRGLVSVWGKGHIFSLSNKNWFLRFKSRTAPTSGTTRRSFWALLVYSVSSGELRPSCRYSQTRNIFLWEHPMSLSEAT